MAGYADEDEACRQLGLVDTDPADAAAIVRVAVLNEALSRVFDHECGRDGTATETRTVEAGGGLSGGVWWWNWAWMSNAQVALAPPSAVLILPSPVRSVDAIAEGGTWDGTAWDDEVAVDVADYRLTFGGDARGYYGIERTGGGTWAGPVRITGTWVDAAFDPPPPEVVEALTYLTVHHYREDLMSPAGVVGPEGEQVPSRNPWAMRRVSGVIERYRVKELVV